MLDLGSGCGYKLHILTTKYHAQGLGIDVSRRNVLYSTANYSKQGVLNFCVGNGLASSALRGQYDLVMEYAGGIMYSPNECIAMRIALTLLKPGGALFRGQVEQVTMRPSWVWKCLKPRGGFPPCFSRDNETRWCQHNGYTVAFMRLKKFFRETTYRRFNPYFVFILKKINITDLAKLPRLSTFYGIGGYNVSGMAP